MSCLASGTLYPLLKWTVRLCVTITCLTLIAALYLHPNGVFFRKETSPKSAKSTYSFPTDDPLKETSPKPAKSTYSFPTDGPLKETSPKPAKLTYSFPTDGPLKETSPKPAKSTHINFQYERLGKRRVVGMRRLPQAIIFGVKKCGTHALTDMISLHPQVVHASKYEMHFFEKNKKTGSDKIYQRGLEWYQSKMPPSYEDQITMEKTPSYFISVDAPKRIYEMNSTIKLILIVREPTTRVVSDYIHTKDLHEVLNLKPFEKEVIQKNGEVDKWHFVVKPSLYAFHMTRWLQVFKREQILVVDGDKLVSDPLSEITRVEKFLNLQPYVKKDNLFWNPEKGFYCMRSQKKDWCLRPTKGRTHPQMDPKVMSKLRMFFAPLNKEFYKMVGHNFSWPTS